MNGRALEEGKQLQFFKPQLEYQTHKERKSSFLRIEQNTIEMRVFIERFEMSSSWINQLGDAMKCGERDHHSNLDHFRRIWMKT